VKSKRKLYTFNIQWLRVNALIQKKEGTKARLKPSKANMKYFSSMSDIWDMWLSNLSSTGLGELHHYTLAVHIAFLLGYFIWCMKLYLADALCSWQFHLLGSLF
jgi:hypothetical protein